MPAAFLSAFQSRTDLANYGTNALLLFALELKYQLPDIDSVAVNALTDGPDDKKCDLIYVDRERGLAIVAQGYMASDATKAEAKANKATDLNGAASWLLTTRTVKKLELVFQYLRHLSGVDRMIDPPKCSHLGHHLINKNGIGHCRKQLSCVDHLWLPAEPRFESVDAACWPRSPHRPHEGMGDIDHAHGQIGTLIHRLFMDVHDVCESPILLRVSTIARQLEAQPIRVASWIIPQRHVTPQEYDLRCCGGLQRRCDHHDHRQHGGKLLLPQRPLVSAGLSLVLDTRGLQVL